MEALHLISGGDSGGAMTHVLSLLAELNTGGEALLLTLGEGPLSREAERRGLPCRVLRGSFAAALGQTREACGEYAPRVLHCHGSRANLTGALLRPSLSCPVITTVHSDPRLDYQGRIAAALSYGALNAWALGQMDALVCVSQAMGARMRARGVPAERIYTVYNGIEPLRPPVPVPRERWRAEREIPPEAVAVGSAARMDGVKDLPTLLRGFAAAAKKDSRLLLALAGSGREESALRRLASELRISHRVRFLGWVEDMESFYSAMDLFALTSRWETFPYVLLSAGRAGLPAVVSAVGGMPELVEEGKSGCLFPAGDSAALGRILLDLAGDDARRAALGEALRQRTRRYTPQKTAEQMRQIYRALPPHRRKKNRF